MASIYGIFRSQTHTIKGQESRMEAHEYAMAILDVMVREVRNTGYFPTGTACENVSNTAESRPRRPQGFSFMTRTETAPAAVTMKLLRLLMTALTGMLPAIARPSQREMSRLFSLLTTLNRLPARLRLYCFSTGIPAGCSGNLASSLSAVQKIAVSITVQSKNPDVQFGGQSTITMSSSADLRNHGLPS